MTELWKQYATTSSKFYNDSNYKKILTEWDVLSVMITDSDDQDRTSLVGYWRNDLAEVGDLPIERNSLNRFNEFLKISKSSYSSQPYISPINNSALFFIARVEAQNN
ncbi:MAG: hypothetical protein KDD25_06535, partial [Bdellovibrionales bacterium]|nr:hypothetical protein [Bdellovibrionales bacterium]